MSAMERTQKANERRWQAKQLRLAGKTYREIGESFGISPARARQIITARTNLPFAALRDHSLMAWVLSWTFQHEDEVRQATDDAIAQALGRFPPGFWYWEAIDNSDIAGRVAWIRRVYPAVVRETEDPA